MDENNKKGAENKQKMEICPPAFKWHAASWQPAIQQANTHENGMKTVRKRKIHGSGPRLPTARPKVGEDARDGNGIKKETETETKMNVLFFVFMAFWHPDRNRKTDKKSRTN